MVSTQLWDWGWTYQGVKINNCSVGLDASALAQPDAPNVQSVVFFDSEISNTAVGILTSRDASTTTAGGSLVLENVALNNVPVAVQGPGRATVLAGSSGIAKIEAWGQGREYGQRTGNLVGQIPPNQRPASLTSGIDYYAQSKPQYGTLPASQFISARSEGATGDGKSDDTDALQKAIIKAAVSGKVLFVDAGYYKVTKTLHIPPGSRVSHRRNE